MASSVQTAQYDYCGMGSRLRLYAQLELPGGTFHCAGLALLQPVIETVQGLAESDSQQLTQTKLGSPGSRCVQALAVRQNPLGDGNVMGACSCIVEARFGL